MPIDVFALQYILPDAGRDKMNREEDRCRVPAEGEAVIGTMTRSGRAMDGRTFKGVTLVWTSELLRLRGRPKSAAGPRGWIVGMPVGPSCSWRREEEPEKLCLPGR